MTISTWQKVLAERRRRLRIIFAYQAMGISIGRAAAAADIHVEHAERLVREYHQETVAILKFRGQQ